MDQLKLKMDIKFFRVNKSSENVIVTDRGRGPHTLYVKALED